MKKPNGSLCVAKNLSIVNKNAINDAYPMNRLKDKLEALSGSSVLIMLDTTKGYHQMRLAEESREITAFFSPKVLF